MKYDIFFSNQSFGLEVDAKILASTIINCGGSVRLFPIPYHYFLNTFEINSGIFSIPNVDSNTNAIFLESIFEHFEVEKYKKRIFIPNPECFVDRDVPKLVLINSMWHKTRFSVNQLSGLYSNIEHHFIGFTSIGIENHHNQLDYEKFIHFRGKSSQRHTQEIINIWNSDETLPLLKVQAYGPDLPISIDRWLSGSNVKIFFGYMDRSTYLKEITSGGIHLCLSSHEGFGHYINEARSLGALILTLDAPPMNEMITHDSGFLVPVTKQASCHHGVTYSASEADIKDCINSILKSSVKERKLLGSKSKKLFEIQKIDFIRNVSALIG